MSVKTQAIVLHHIPYSDSGVIAHLYTRQEGRISVFVRSGSRRSVMRATFLQPFSVLDLVLHGKPQSTMMYVKECSPSLIFNSIPFNSIKSSITLFLSEVLYRTLKVQHSDKVLFDFLVSSIEFFDNCDKGTGNFHLLFLLQLSKYLGFYPNVENFSNQKKTFFDLKNGCLCLEKPLHPFFLSEEQTVNFLLILRFNYQTMYLLKLSREQRQHILEQIMLFLQLHLPEFGSVKSIGIIKQIFD
ncbi:MAG: DNA repair protein RecO [Prevotellaceae bacterium]|jgi:DNA repair protein RecO (recombination protein O)|nr:DNA repair protein RecO [Prevotellaceae bacterium]